MTVTRTNKFELQVGDVMIAQDNCHWVVMNIIHNGIRRGDEAVAACCINNPEPRLLYKPLLFDRFRSASSMGLTPFIVIRDGDVVFKTNHWRQVQGHK